MSEANRPAESKDPYSNEIPSRPIFHHFWVLRRGVCN